MKLPQLVGALLANGALSQAQSGNYGTFSDPGIGLDIKLAIPDASAAPFPLLMTISAPLSVGWAGFATGGCMLRSPLILAWPNNNSVVVTTRWATQFHPPSPYLNTTITALPSSSVNATHWTADLLCSRGCSDWYGGAIDPNNNNATFGYAACSHAPAMPADVTSSIHFHDLAIAHFDLDLTKAKNSAAAFDGLVKGFGGKGAR